MSLEKKTSTPLKTGSSHALAVFSCTILAALAAESLKPVVPRLYNAVQGIANTIVQFLHLQVSTAVIGTALVASGFAFIWGIAYHLQRRRRGGW